MKEKLLKRIMTYTSIGTQSDRELAKVSKPSTSCQWDLLDLLRKEMTELGLERIELTAEGFLFGRLGGTGKSKAPSIGFMAHVDTASDAPAMNVKPRVHHNYQGGDIVLDGGIVISPEEDEALLMYKGDQIITSSGTTLLGADDKAGIGVIMTMVEYLLDHKEIEHGPIEVIFTPDEETGYGMTGFPLEKLESKLCYTVDGGHEGEIEEECYYAYGAEITFTGVAIHPGKARGKLVNAASMAAYFATLIPRSESPEATDGRFGNYWVHHIEGAIESASVTVMVRDFEQEGINRRLASLSSFAQATEAAFPGGHVEVTSTKQYVNMKEGISKEPRLMAFLREALSAVGVEPLYQPIRGGTDGSRLTEMGIPTPNIYTGGHNYHSRKEWIPLSAMESSCKVLVKLVEQWGRE